MGSKPGSSITMEMRRTRRRQCRKAQRKGPSRMLEVSEKLVALNNLINPLQTSEEVKTDELFQETANYIVLLKTQVSILQKLVDFYESSRHDEQVQHDQNVVV